VVARWRAGPSFAVVQKPFGCWWRALVLHTANQSQLRHTLETERYRHLSHARHLRRQNCVSADQLRMLTSDGLSCHVPLSSLSQAPTSSSEVRAQ